MKVFKTELQYTSTYLVRLSQLTNYMMADLDSLKLKFNQDAMNMGTCLGLISPTNTMNQALFLHMKKLLDKAFDYSLQLGTTTATIEMFHTADIPPDNLSTMKAKVAELLVKYDNCMKSLMQNDPNPTHASLVNGDQAQALAQAGEARRLRKAKGQALLKHDHIKFDLEAFVSSFSKLSDWATAEDHVIAWGMKSRKEWKIQHLALSKDILEVQSIISVNSITDLGEMVNETHSKINFYGSLLDQKIDEIERADIAQGLFSDRDTKPCPVKLPTFAGLAFEDFIIFKDRFTKAARDNKIPRTDQVEKLCEVLTGKALAYLPQEGIGDIDLAWEYLEQAFGNPYTILNFHLAQFMSMPSKA